MILKGSVTLDGQPIGSFQVESHDLDIAFNKGETSLEETMEFATEHGMRLGLMLEPEFSDE
jgi:hypothetical protein